MITVPPRYRTAVDDVRSRLSGGEQMLFDVLCLSATLGQGLPQDDINYQDLKGTLNPDRKSTRLNSSHVKRSRMPSSA